MIVVTGAAGFIGSCMVQQLNDHNFNRIIAVDDFSDEGKNRNLEGKKISAKVPREEFFAWLADNHEETEFIFHLGARTDTTERDRDLLWRLNTNYSKEIWQKCIDYQIPLIYASSAATYGDGTYGYNDQQPIDELKPLNAYGDSKQAFDVWARGQEHQPFFWAGLKFFNVYGPNEYHKGRMASVVYHAYQQISQSGRVKLFRSHRPDFEDGGQMRDFIYVKDVVAVMYWLMRHRRNSGHYNVGTGRARSFSDLANAVFDAVGAERKIEYVDTPADIRDKYQYFTEATMSKLRAAGFVSEFHSLEEGVKDYVSRYLGHMPEAPRYF